MPSVPSTLSAFSAVPARPAGLRAATGASVALALLLAALPAAAAPTGVAARAAGPAGFSSTFDGGATGVASPRQLIGTEAPALRLALGERARLVYQPPQADVGAGPLARQRGRLGLGLAEPPEDGHALGLEFRRPAREGDPRNLLRVQLSGGSVLHFRPRGGGLHVRWQMTY